MNRQILRWNRLGDGRFGVKVLVSLMCFDFWNPFRMTGSGESNLPSHHSKSPQGFQSPLNHIKSLRGFGPLRRTFPMCGQCRPTPVRRSNSEPKGVPPFVLLQGQHPSHQQTLAADTIGRRRATGGRRPEEPDFSQREHNERSSMDVH